MFAGKFDLDVYGPTVSDTMTHDVGLAMMPYVHDGAVLGVELAHRVISSYAAVVTEGYDDTVLKNRFFVDVNRLPCGWRSGSLELLISQGFVELPCSDGLTGSLELPLQLESPLQVVDALTVAPIGQASPILVVSEFTPHTWDVPVDVTQFFQIFQSTEFAGHPIKLVVQPTPVIASSVAVTQTLGLSDPPLNQGISLAGVIGRPMGFIGCDTNTLDVLRLIAEVLADNTGFQLCTPATPLEAAPGVAEVLATLDWAIKHPIVEWFLRVKRGEGDTLLLHQFLVYHQDNLYSMLQILHLLTLYTIFQLVKLYKL